MARPTTASNIATTSPDGGAVRSVATSAAIAPATHPGVAGMMSNMPCGPPSRPNCQSVATANPTNIPAIAPAVLHRRQ